MKSISFRIPIYLILFYVVLYALDLTKVYAAAESGLSQNCGIYGQTDMFTKEQVQEMNEIILHSSQEVKLNIVFYLTNKELTSEETASIYYETVGATEGLIYFMDTSKNRELGDKMVCYGKAQTYYSSQFEMLSEELLNILPCDNYTDANKYYIAIGKICTLFKDYAGFPKFYHPRYILKNMATFDPIGWLESLPSSIGFVLSLIVFLAAIAEVFYFRKSIYRHYCRDNCFFYSKRTCVAGYCFDMGSAAMVT